MNIRAKLESVKLPQVLAELRHANQFLKIYSAGATFLSLLCLSLVLLLLNKESEIIVLSETGSRLAINERPDPNAQVVSALTEYIKHRYSWEPKTIKTQLALARQFVRDSALKSFDSGLAEVEKFALERNVTQRGYAASIEVDLQKQIASVKGDRVTSIQGLTASGQLNLVLQFEPGPRTKANPWGIYIVRERNE
jgi:hypothetical protein